MYNYKMTVAYDGTRYKGWQSQKTTDETIQGKLEGILQKQMGYPVQVIGSGRTDAGVHAKGQVANFHLKESADEEELLRIFNSYLPKDIAVLLVKRAGDRFHSRFSAIDKTYRYRIHTGIVPEVFERNYVYSHTDSLRLEDMKKASEYLIGTKDFSSFCGNSHMKKSTVRSLYEIRFENTKNEIAIDYRGNSFLQNMARILTGTLIEVGEGKKKPEDMAYILEAKNRELAGFTAPAQGLTLLEVAYS